MLWKVRRGTFRPPELSSFEVVGSSLGRSPHWYAILALRIPSAYSSGV